MAGSAGTSYIYAGDRWTTSNLGTSPLVWLPMTIAGNTVNVGWQNSWQLDVTTGTWSAGSSNPASGTTHVLTNANSSLVKTSWCGGDPNWGRIIDALGYSSAKIVENKVDVGYSLPGSLEILYSLKRGQPTRVPFPSLCRVAAEAEFDLHINLNLGHSRALLYAADLTEAYVDFNKGDMSDPASLGG